MSRETFWRIVILVAVLACLTAAFWHAARADDTVIPGKFYVTVTLADKTSDQMYAKLRFNPAGSFDTEKECIA